MPVKKFVGSREWSDLPRIEAQSLRWGFYWEFHRPRRYFYLGIPESGKSELNESIALRHPKIWDIYGSKDNEGLCWCRESSGLDDILLVHGDNTDVDCSWDTCKVQDLAMRNLDRYEVVITSHAFYSSDTKKYNGVELLADQGYERKTWRPGDIIYMVMRETMNVLFAKIAMGLNEKDAKAALLYLFREIRHFGFSVGADSLRWTGIDKEFRDLADYTIFKRLGEKGLPREKWFMYQYIAPPIFALMPINRFICLRVDGAISMGWNQHVPCHKEEGVDLLAELGIRVTHGLEAKDSTAMFVGDDEHVKIIELYLKIGTTRGVARALVPKRSNSTVAGQIQRHNQEILERGQCRSCQIAAPDHAKILVKSPGELAREAATTPALNHPTPAEAIQRP